MHSFTNYVLSFLVKCFRTVCCCKNVLKSLNNNTAMYYWICVQKIHYLQSYTSMVLYVANDKYKCWKDAFILSFVGGNKIRPIIDFNSYIIYYIKTDIF